MLIKIYYWLTTKGSYAISRGTKYSCNVSHLAWRSNIPKYVIFKLTTKLSIISQRPVAKWNLRVFSLRYAKPKSDIPLGYL